MRLQRVSLIIFGLSTLLTLIGATVKVLSLGPPDLGSYLLGGGFSLWLAAVIGLYLVSQRAAKVRNAEPEDERVKLPDLEKRSHKNENLR